MKKAKKIASLLLLFLLPALSARIYAVSLSPEAVEKLRANGSLQEWTVVAQQAKEKGVWRPNPRPPIRLGKDGSLETDTLKPVFLLVDFDDNLHSHDSSEFTNLLFSTGFSYPTGSFRDYYLENSCGQLDLPGAVYGWIRAPQPYSYYENDAFGLGSYPQNAQRLVEDAVYAANPYVDFSEFDHDGDGWVDALNVIHAGPGAEEVGAGAIWSHKWATQAVLTLDGVSMHEYTMTPERRAGGGLVAIGAICYEFGYLLGAVSLLDYDFSSLGLTGWSIMAGGVWFNGGDTPAHFDAYNKYKMGFSQVFNLTSNQTNVEILQAETSPVAYRLWTSGAQGPVYFLVENRQKTGFDAYLPGEGLLIYHVDELQPDNASEWCPGDPPHPHYLVALEQADGLFNLEGCYGDLHSGDEGDPFPGSSDKRAFDDTTTPDSRNYDAQSPTQVAVWNISDSDSAMHANMNVRSERGDLNGDGTIDPGDVVYLLNYLFRSGPQPYPLWTGDCNCDEVVDPSDVVYLLNYLFRGGPPPSC